MMQRILLGFILLGLLASSVCCQETNNEKQYYDNVYHFIFQMDIESIEKSDEDIRSLSDEVFNVLKEKTDYLGIGDAQLLLTGEDRDIFVITYSDVKDPKKIIDVIEPDKLPIPSKLVTFFKCDFTHK